MNRTLRNTTLALLVSLVGVTALANGHSEKLDGSGFTVQAAQNQAATQYARGEMWLTEGDEGFDSTERIYAFALQIVQPEVQQRYSLAQGLGERLER